MPRSAKPYLEVFPDIYKQLQQATLDGFCRMVTRQLIDLFLSDEDVRRQTQLRVASSHRQISSNGRKFVDLLPEKLEQYREMAQKLYPDKALVEVTSGLVTAYLNDQRLRDAVAIRIGRKITQGEA